MARLLRDQISPGQLSGQAFIDTPELEALDRLLVGPLRSYQDLLLCESGIRAFILHTHSSSLDEFYERGPFLQEFPQLLTNEPLPTLELVSDDPDIPEAVRTDLLAMIDFSNAYLTGTMGRVPEVLLFSAATREVRSVARGIVSDTPARGFPQVVEEANRIVQRAVRLLTAYFGGAGLFAADLPPTIPTRLSGGAPIPDLLEVLDERYDYGLVGERRVRPVLQLPPFISIVLSRSRGRSDIPKTLLSLKEELEPQASVLHVALRTLHASTVRSDVKEARQLVDGVVDQFNKRATAASASVMLRIRGLGLPAVSALVTVLNPATAAASAALALITLADALARDVTVMGRLTPSLADQVFQMAQQAGLVVPENVLRRHLSDGELQDVLGPPLSL